MRNYNILTYADGTQKLLISRDQDQQGHLETTLFLDICEGVGYIIINNEETHQGLGQDIYFNRAVVSWSYLSETEYNDLLEQKKIKKLEPIPVSRVSYVSKRKKR